MVLPLLIGGAAVVFVGAILYKASDSFGEGFKNLTTTKEQKQLELKQDKFSYKQSQRGFLQNVFAATFGENTLEAVNKDTAKPQAPLTGTQVKFPYQHIPVLNQFIFPANVAKYVLNRPSNTGDRKNG